MNTSTILVVDDCKSIRDVITFMLKQGGFEVKQASNGREGLDMAHHEHFDAILTDINMPEMDGYTLIKSLRQQAGYRTTPILTITTEHTDESKRQGREAGATGWVTKPFNPEKLLATLNRLIH